MGVRRTRLMECREAAGFSQASLAKAIQVNRTTVQRWETGESEPRKRQRPTLARLLGVTLGELARMIDVGPESSAPGTTMDLARSRSADAAEPADGGPELQRRDFLHVLAATGVAAAGHLLPNMDQPPLIKLRAAVDRAVRFEHRSQYAALRSTLPSLVAHAHEVVEAHEGASRQEAERLLSNAQLVEAFTLIKHDLPTEAIATATAALTTAHASGDPVAVGAALRCLSETHLRGGDYDLATDLGIEGAAVIERADAPGVEATAVRGACLLSAATARARAGDRRSAFELLAAAAHQADRLGQELIGTVVFGPMNVAIHHVAFEVELNDPIQALKYADAFRVEDGRGLEERRSRYLIDVARAHAARGQDDEAILTLLHAESISPEETRTHRLTRATLIDLVDRRPVRMATGLTPLAERCGVIETA